MRAEYEHDNAAPTLPLENNNRPGNKLSSFASLRASKESVHFALGRVCPFLVSWRNFGCLARAWCLMLSQASPGRETKYDFSSGKWTPVFIFYTSFDRRSMELVAKSAKLSGQGRRMKSHHLERRIGAKICKRLRWDARNSRSAAAVAF